MNDLGFNKIAAAVLATALGFILIKELSHSTMHISAPDTPVYPAELPGMEKPDVEVKDLPFPQENWIAAMDSERGAKVFKKCTSCHNADNGGNHSTGPNLFEIVGNPAAQKAGFGYSSALATSGIVWDYEALDGFLTKPSTYLPGVEMNFVGIKKEADRAAVIEYLRLAASTPVGRPSAATIEASAELVEDMAETVEEGAEALTDTVDGIVDQTGEVLEGGADIVTETVNEAVEAGEDLVEGAIDTGETVVEDIVEDIVEDVKEEAAEH